VKIKRHAAVIGFIAAGALALSACGSDQNAPAGGGAGAPTNSAPVECGGKPSLTGEGSTAQKGAMDLFVQAYGQKCSGAQLNYTASGSGAGVKQFLGGQVDIGGSDSALSKDKGEVDQAAARCKGNPAWNLPVVFGPVAIAYKLGGVTDLTLNAEVAAKIFNGTIKTWDDPAIKALNPSANLPAGKPIAIVFRADESGTTDNFQRYLKAASKGAWGKDAGKKFNGGVGDGKQGNAGVSDAVAGLDGGITYIEWKYAQDKNLSMAKIDSGSGPVELTAETAANTIKNPTLKGEGNDLVLDLDAIYAGNTPGAYPLVLATYEIVCSKGYDPDTAKAVKAFLTAAVTDGQQGLVDEGYIPLPSELQAKLLTAINAIA
jgi:phosphate transport system substrate-binding protein